MNNNSKKVTWKKPNGIFFTSRSDEYHRKLYESKGYTLITMPDGATLGSSIVTTATEPKDIYNRLADGVLEVLHGGHFWQGTATELLAIIDTGEEDIPSVPNRLSSQIVQPHVIEILKEHGISVERRRTGRERTIVLSRRG